MNNRHTISQWLETLGVDLAQLAASSGLDARLVDAIAAGRYTTSPIQRDRIARAIGVPAEQIQWGRAVDVDHMYGHGPQFGRSP